jgi:hypothetical protein
MTKTFLLWAAVCVVTMTSLVRAAEMDKIAYPTADAASFVITVPSNWKMEPAEEEGDYFHLSSPTGAVFSFRTIEGGEKALNKAIEASVKDLNERFNEMNLGDAEDWKPHGLTGFYATGHGKEKDDGTPVRVAVAWCALTDGKIAELWFVADLDDEKGINQASDIANSLESPE